MFRGTFKGCGAPSGHIATKNASVSGSLFIRESSSVFCEFYDLKKERCGRYDVTAREDNREDMVKATEYRRERFADNSTTDAEKRAKLLRIP